MHPINDIAATLLGPKGNITPQTMVNATALAGTIVDRQGYESALVFAIGTLTTAAGQAGATIALVLALYDDTASGMGSEVVYKTYTYTYTWATDSAKTFALALPVNLKDANRYVRAKLTHTKDGTVTVSAQVGAAGIVFGGLVKEPDVDYVADGYCTLTPTA